MELDFDSLNWSSMMVDSYNIKPKQDIRKLFPGVFNFKEYYEELHEVDITKFLRFIPMCYDKNSPLRQHFTEINRLKIKAADLAGFVRQEDGKFLSNVEEVLAGSNEVANRMIIRYVIQHKNSLYTRFVMYQELYENEMQKLRSGDKGVAKISEFDILGDKLDEIRQELFSQDNNQKLQQDFTQFYFEDKLLLRPEDIAEKLRKGEIPVSPPEKKKLEKQPSQKILDEYEKEDKEVVINTDPNLHPIYIKLPKCEDYTQVEGYGLKAENQKFQIPTIPNRLLQLVNQCDKIDEVWATLSANQAEYKKEIRWIEDQWYYSLNGYWFYNNGKPTYICGWHYFYLVFWKIGGTISPEYRDRDRKWYHAVRYAYTTTETIDLDANGKPIYLNVEEKRLKMKDIKRRTFSGYVGPKFRRAGDSNKHLCAQYFETITSFGVISGIISSGGDHAREKLFDEILVTSWQKIMFFFKPITSSNENPNNVIAFAAGRTKADKSKTQIQLKSKINVATTAAPGAYDGGKLKWLLADEGGKTTEVDVYSRHQILKLCVSQGAGTIIVGMIGMPSTVGEMEGAGGKAYHKICKDSFFEKRGKLGQTVTGLMLIYMSCEEGLEGFVDEYGYSVIENPTPRQRKFINGDIGAREYIKSERLRLLEDPKMQEDYNEFVRLHPLKYAECFRTSDGDIGFNTKILNERIEEISMNEHNWIRTGNFEWTGEPFNSRVDFKDNPNGKWKVSQLLPPNVSSKFNWAIINGEAQRVPFNPKHVTCCDPYKQEKTQSGRMSDLGIATAYDYDPSVDHGKEAKDWQSYRLVCTYLGRPGSTDDQYEDVLLQAIYYNSWLYPEINVAEIIPFMTKKGFAGYFLYDFDWKTGKLRVTPGFNSQGEKKQNLFNTTRNYISVHGHKEKHADFLQQCKDISSMEEMTDYDLFTAGSGALMGCSSVMAQEQKTKNETVKKPNMFKKRKYS